MASDSAKYLAKVYSEKKAGGGELPWPLPSGRPEYLGSEDSMLEGKSCSIVQWTSLNDDLVL